MTDHAHSIPVQRLRAGDHACMDFTDVEARWEVVAAYTRSGLACGEKVMVVLDPNDLSDEDAVSRLDSGTGTVRAARDNGQLVLARNTDVYIPDGRLDSERQVRAYAAVLAQTREQGYTGLRVGGDAAFAPQAGIPDDQLIDYEMSVGPLFADRDLTALCWYDRNQFSEHVVATARKIHPLRVMERLGALEVTQSPDTARIAGSAHAGTRTEFTEALGALLGRRPAQSGLRFELDLTDLWYIEGHCAWQLIEFAAGLPDDHTLVVRCGPTLEMALRGLGADDVPRLELIVQDA